MIERMQLAVVDTSVVSIIFNSRAKSSAYADLLDGKRAFISFQTLEEGLYGAYLARWGSRRIAELNDHLGLYTVVWPNHELVGIAASIRSCRERAGRKLHVADAWVAATALLLGCPLISDDGDFEDIPDLELQRIEPR